MLAQIRFSNRARRAILITIFALTFCQITLQLRAQTTELSLYKFGVTGSTRTPRGPLVIDADGSLYGVSDGGANNSGAVFKLSQTENGWEQTDLYNFSDFPDGGDPNPGLIRDADGNFYGTTQFGGAIGGNCEFSGCGTVFKLSPDPSGRLKLTASYAFIGEDDQGYPAAGVVMDAQGNLYGTTTGVEYGSIFKLTPAKRGWNVRTIHNFRDVDGAFPTGKLIFDSAGNLYGTAPNGGGSCSIESIGCGVVFELSPADNDSWTLKVLHRFNGNDGAFPGSGLVLDQVGNLYGTTAGGGVPGCPNGPGCGVVFQLSPKADGSWKKTVVHTFSGGRDGGTPMGDLAFDSTGSLVGTTYYGGLHDKGKGYGTVFRLTPKAGRWQGAILHTFHAADDGGYPTTGLSMDRAGNFFGAANGGVHNDACYRGCGVVYEVLAPAP